MEDKDCIERKSWPFKVSPRSDDYRIVEFEHRDENKYHLQAKVDTRWVDVKAYDEGTYAWKKIGDTKNWSLNEIKQIRNELLGFPEVFKIVEDTPASAKSKK